MTTPVPKTSEVTPRPSGIISYPKFPDIIIDPKSPEITNDIFDKIKTQNAFGDLIKREFDECSRDAALEPEYSVDLLHDAYQSYQWDVERLDDNMPNSPSPDHFKLSGYLAYWLRRNSPILRWKPTTAEHRINEDEKEFRQFIFDYGRVYHPFMLGYRICWFFERNKETESPILKSIDGDYINTVCYYMKYKSVSPHSLGLLYRSLFFV